MDGTYFHIPQALDKMEAGQHTMLQCVTMETDEIITPPCVTETCTDGEKNKQELEKREEYKSGEELNEFPTLHNGAALSRGTGCEDGVGTADEAAFCQQMDERNNGCLSAEDCEASPPERMLQESVDRLKTLMEADVWRERQTSGPQSTFPNINYNWFVNPFYLLKTLTNSILCSFFPGDKRWIELLVTADQVEDSIHRLVDAVRIKPDDSFFLVLGPTHTRSPAGCKSTSGGCCCSAGGSDITRH